MEKFRVHLKTNHIIYPTPGNPAGFQDYGIIGSKIKKKVLDVWHKVMMDENIHEISTPIVTDRSVLERSGHVTKFTDPIVTDKDDIKHRADHLIEDYISKNANHIAMESGLSDVASMTLQNMEDFIKKHKLVDIASDKVKVTESVLMCGTDNGNFLRPELAQGIFLNFKQGYDFCKKLPFGLKQVGRSYRKEISPKPFTRLVEFTQAEIEWFYDPETSSNLVSEDITPNMLPRDKEPYVAERMNINKVITNDMAFFLTKAWNFAKEIGIPEESMRLRQHLSNEMAHYARDCWDLEILINGKWLECMGCADRGDYDLKTHGICLNKFVKNSMNTIKSVVPNKKIIGPIFGPDTNTVCDILRKSSPDKIPGNAIGKNITSDMYTIDELAMANVAEPMIPCVIEPSFGIDRLIYAMLFLNFKKRDDTKYYMTLPSKTAPYTGAVLPLLTNNKELIDITKKIRSNFGFDVLYTDLSSATIGKKYVRIDELGIPIALTVDHQTIIDRTVTMRHNESMQQVRINIDDINTYL